LETKYDLALCKSAIKTKQMDKKDDGVSDVVEAYIVFEDEEAKARALKAHHSHSSFYRQAHPSPLSPCCIIPTLPPLTALLQFVTEVSRACLECTMLR